MKQKTIENLKRVSNAMTFIEEDGFRSLKPNVAITLFIFIFIVFGVVNAWAM